jgi:hypothetical protein
MNNNISLLKLINGASKTLNLVNELIPIYKKVQPIMEKSKKYLNNQTINKTKEVPSSTPIQNNQPTFFQ